MIIGGAERHRTDRAVLRRFIDLCGQPDPNIAIVTAAGADPDGSWRRYRDTFASLGADRCRHVRARSEVAIERAEALDALRSADGILLTGGDQNRLMRVLGGSTAQAAILHANRARRACVAGTSAGAAALSTHMLAGGSPFVVPRVGDARIAPGLGLLPIAIIDQHLSERRRLSRLLSALARLPALVGIGVDEDTALVIDAARGIEVVGSGTVTIVDASRLRTNAGNAEPQDTLRLLGVRLHLLLAGDAYPIGSDAPPVTDTAMSIATPASLRDVFRRLVAR